MARIASLVALAALAACLSCASAQYRSSQPQTTPVPILKQINRHNEDGSYSYGYEGADGSFKIETKFPTGEVLGKYGYVDDSGKTHEIEYGASKRGFEVAGTGINVPPPTLTNNNLDSTDYDDGQYREDPNIYLKETASGARAGPFGPPAPRPAPAAPVRQQYSSPAYSAAPRTPSHIQQYFSQANQYNPAPAYNPEPAPAYRQPAPAHKPPPPSNPPPPPHPPPPLQPRPRLQPRPVLQPRALPGGPQPVPRPPRPEHRHQVRVLLRAVQRVEPRPRSRASVVCLYKP